MRHFEFETPGLEKLFCKTNTWSICDFEISYLKLNLSYKFLQNVGPFTFSIRKMTALTNHMFSNDFSTLSKKVVQKVFFDHKNIKENHCYEIYEDMLQKII